MKFTDTEIKKIRVTGNNPRIINKKSNEFRELVGSIKAIGVKVPIHIRESNNGKAGFELLAGERRLLASIEAGCEVIPALNHGRLSDADAFEITFAENYQREDLTVLEQGKAVATLLEKFKGDTAAVAAKMGKSVKWVLQRRAIHENLSKSWRKNISEDLDLKSWTISHLQLIAAMPENIQDELFEEFVYGREMPTVKELEKEIAGIMRMLEMAPWNKKDPKLVKGAPACVKCTKRTSCQPGLFDDTTDEDTIKKNDRCLDIECWNLKMKAYIELRAAELRKEHKSLVYAVMPDEQLNWNEKQEIESVFGEVAFQWKGAKEGEKGAVPALIVYGKNAGDTRWVKFPKIETGTSAEKTGEKKPTPLKERRKMLDKKRWFVVIRNLIEKIEKCGVEKIVSKNRVFTVMALTATFGTTLDLAWREKGKWRSFDKIKTLKDALAKLWAAVRKTICDNLTYMGPITQTPDDLINAAKRAAKLLGIDIKAMFKEASEKDYPEPKTWVKLNEDGTPKNSKKPRGKKKK